jgi:glycosyltransferase involved in cell wall biosynthesis
MASKTPFLTTDVGNASEIIKWSGAGDILPTIKFENGYCKAEINGSAIKLRNVFNNSNLRQKMKISGYQTWLNKFTWDNIAKQYEEVYAKLLEKPF